MVLKMHLKSAIQKMEKKKKKKKKSKTEVLPADAICWFFASLHLYIQHILYYPTDKNDHAKCFKTRNKIVNSHKTWNIFL